MDRDFDRIIREHFDISDTPTRKCMIALEDAQQAQVLSALSSALYDKIVDKVDNIDFGTIPMSRGDITKVQGFDSTVECLDIMRKLVIEYKQDPKVVDTVLTAIDNVKERKAVFMKAYALNIEFPIVLYNLIVAAIENSVSFLISVCIQYVKDPETNSIETALDKTAYNNANQNMLYQQLERFNESCSNGELDNALKEIMQTGGKVAEAFADIKDNDHNTTYVFNIGGKSHHPHISPFEKFEGEECDDEPGFVKPDHDDAQMDYYPGDEEIHEEEPKPEEDDIPEDPYYLDGIDGTDDEVPYDDDEDYFEKEIGGCCSEVDDDMQPQPAIPSSPSSDDDVMDDYEDDYIGEKEDLRTVKPGMQRYAAANKNAREEAYQKKLTELRAKSASSTDKSNQKSTNESIGAVLGGIGIAAGVGFLAVKGYKFLIAVLIPCMRNITYFFISSRVKFSTALQVQAQFLEMNAYKVQTAENDGMDDAKRAKVVKKQLKVAENLKKASNFFAIDHNKASKKAKEEIKKDAKQMKVDDIKDEIPADVYNKSVIF